MDGPVKLLQRIRRQVQSVTYGSSLYQIMLDQGPSPDRPKVYWADPWPGDAKAGQALIARQATLFDGLSGSGREAQRAFLSHEWLRDLRAVGTDMARRRAVAMLLEWMEERGGWEESSWVPDILGARLANWIVFYDFYASQSTVDFHHKLMDQMARQLRHLMHAASAPLVGTALLSVVRGLIAGGVALIESERAVGLGLELLRRQLALEVLADGGLRSRSPLRQAEFLKGLIDIRTALCAGRMEIPADLTLAINRMVPALKFFRHGDGGLALFNGAKEGSALLLDALVTLSEARGRVLKRLPHTGYERLTAGRSLLLVDVGAPPVKPHDAEAHAGLLGFEFSVGRERMIVNCGAEPDGDPAWRTALAATAAHSTLCLDDVNACAIEKEGGVGFACTPVGAQRYELDGTQFVEAGYQGYARQKKAELTRSFGLSADGEVLQGREKIRGAAPGIRYCLRFHLHPKVEALLTQSGEAVLLRLGSGAGWRLRASAGRNGVLAIEPSVYCGGEAPRRTLQIVLSGFMERGGAEIEWTLKREKIKKGGEK